MVELVYTGDLKSPDFGLVGSSPTLGIQGLVAQWSERPSHKRLVVGSIPTEPIKGHISLGIMLHNLKLVLVLQGEYDLENGRNRFNFPHFK